MNIKLLLFILINTMSVNAAIAGCTRISGTTYLEVPSEDGIIAVNDGKYPSPTNGTFVNLSGYNGAAAQWSMICDAPVKVTPTLRTFRYPDARFTNAGYPHMQTSTAGEGNYGFGKGYYSMEMWYTNQDDSRTWFDGRSGNTQQAPSFIVAKDATKENPVTVTLSDLNVDRIGYQGYQVADAINGTFSWGTGGILHYIRFLFSDAATNNTIRNTGWFTLYIDHVNFAVRTCAIVSDDLYKTVQLGDKNGRDFSNNSIGGVTNSVDFMIRLRCLPNTTVSYRINTSTPDTEADPSNMLGLIKLQATNAAQGFAVQLRALPFKQNNGAFIPVSFGKNMTSTITATGDAVGNVTTDFIKFDARYYRTKPASEATSGTANATATIDINYQ